MFIIRFIVFVALILFCTFHAEGTLYMVRGGCIDDPQRWTTRIDSPAENIAVMNFIIAQKLSFAGIAGYVQGGRAYWDDGSAMKFKPSNFKPPATSEIGFLVVRQDGSWDVKSYDVFSNTNFICTDGKETPSNPPSTETPTENPIPTETPTENPIPTETPTENPIPTETPTENPIPTEAPIGPSVSISELLDELKNVIGMIGTIDIVSSITNSVNIPVNTVGLLDNLKILRNKYHYLIGLAFIESTDDTTLSGVSTLTPGEGLTMQFIVPLNLMESSVNRYLIRIVAINGTDKPEYRQTSTKLIIHSVEEVLRSIESNVILTDENILEEKDIVVPLQIMGPGTIATHTTEVSPLVFSSLSLTMINNGVVGRTCSPGTISIDFLIVNGNLQLFLSKDLIMRVKTGPKSLCASIGGKNIVIANFEKKQITFTTHNSKYKYGETIKAIVSGASSSLIASKTYRAYLSNSEKCSSVDGTYVSMELETPVFPLISSEQQQSENIYFTSVSKGSQTKYLCVRHILSKTSFRVLSSEGKTVKIEGVLNSEISTGKISIFNGATGSILLKDNILPIRSTGDTEHFNTISRLITQNSPRIRFVPLSLGSEWIKKVTACSSNIIKSEGDFDSNRGSLQINTPLQLLNSSGILCAGNTYIRIDYVMYEPLKWLQSFGGSSTKLGSAVVPGLASTAVNIIVTNSESSAHYAVRLAENSNCRVGFTANIWETFENYTAVSFPGTISGTFTLCVGIYAADGRTSLFVATDRRITLVPYDKGVKEWEKEHELSSGRWLPCGASAVCGYVPNQSFIEVCGGNINVNQWPNIIINKFLSFGSINVRLPETGKNYPAIIINGRIFIKRSDLTCQTPNLVEMTGDGKVYSTAVVSAREHSIVILKSDTHLSGVIFGLAPWNQKCDSSSIRQKILVSSSYSYLTSGEVSTLDLSQILWDDNNENYMICILQSSTWKTIPQAYIRTITSTGDSSSARAEAIATSNPIEDESIIHIWQTETVSWAIIGFFLPKTQISIALVWDDPTCRVTPAYTSVMKYMSAITSSVLIEVSIIAPAPTKTSLLYSCYFIEGNSPTPLIIEKLLNRGIKILELSLSSINYLPHFAISYDTKENTTIFLSDPLKPPITQLELFIANSPDDKSITDGCSLTSRYHVASLMVQLNEIGQYWSTIPASIPATVGSSDQNVYLLICGTASKKVSPRFVPVNAYLIVSKFGLRVQTSSILSLNLIFLPLNETEIFLQLEDCVEPLRKYVLSVTNRTNNQEGILITKKGNNQFGLFIEPDTTTSIEEAENQLRSVYASMVLGKGLPLRIHSSNNTVFVLFSVAGVELISQSIYSGFPLVSVRVVDVEEIGVPGDLVRQAITIFCVVIAPVVAGFVAFSLQRSVPKLNRIKFGRRSKRRGVEAVVEAVDSPPPRRPLPSSGGTEREKETPSATGRTVAVEDTAANPLYDSDANDEDAAAPVPLACTPPPTIPKTQ